MSYFYKASEAYGQGVLRLEGKGEVLIQTGITFLTTYHFKLAIDFFFFLSFIYLRASTSGGGAEREGEGERES